MGYKCGLKVHYTSECKAEGKSNCIPKDCVYSVHQVSSIPQDTFILTCNFRSGTHAIIVVA